MPPLLCPEPRLCKQSAMCTGSMLDLAAPVLGPAWLLTRCQEAQLTRFRCNSPAKRLLRATTMKRWRLLSLLLLLLFDVCPRSLETPNWPVAPAVLCLLQHALCDIQMRATGVQTKFVSCLKLVASGFMTLLRSSAAQRSDATSVVLSCG